MRSVFFVSVATVLLLAGGARGEAVPPAPAPDPEVTVAADLQRLVRALRNTENHFSHSEYRLDIQHDYQGRIREESALVGRHGETRRTVWKREIPSGDSFVPHLHVVVVTPLWALSTERVFNRAELFRGELLEFHLGPAGELPMWMPPDPYFYMVGAGLRQGRMGSLADLIEEVAPSDVLRITRAVEDEGHETVVVAWRHEGRITFETTFIVKDGFAVVRACSIIRADGTVSKAVSVEYSLAGAVPWPQSVIERHYARDQRLERQTTISVERLATPTRDYSVGDAQLADGDRVSDVMEREHGRDSLLVVYKGHLLLRDEYDMLRRSNLRIFSVFSAGH